MNEENVTSETEDMNEDMREVSGEDRVTEEKELTDMPEVNDTEPISAAESDGTEPISAAESDGTEPIAETESAEPSDEPSVMPLKKVNRFFLAALFPLLFIIIFGAILLITGRGDGEQTDVPTEEPYYEVKADEVRGVYIASVYNINYPSAQGLDAARLKAELDEILLTCAENGFNAVYFQVSPMSDALYASDILPVSSVLTGREGDPLPEGFDPLAYLCNKAHKAGIAVHAWVNPVRITAGGHDAEDLSSDNPAVKEPEYTVTYGGELYYDLGYPEVRALQARVCEELAGDYPVDGIIFDDYFYPYPVEGEKFDDSASYALHGGDYDNVEDFRRASAAALVTECCDAVKGTREDCLFGIAPFGIWRNNDGKNGGSNTTGMESYSEIYCDSLAFIKSGKLDYIAPQLYWPFKSKAAPYAELCDWWAEAVSGTDVRLLISHAAYQAATWENSGEYAEQVEYARTKRDYYGSIFYGYAAIDGNDASITDAFAEIYKED